MATSCSGGRAAAATGTSSATATPSPPATPAPASRACTEAPRRRRRPGHLPGYVFPEIAARLADASSESDEKTRNKKLADVQKAIWDTRPCLWAFIPNVVLARRTRVHDVRLLQVNSYDLAAVRLEG
ncbi:hypothetical protein SAZ11_06710 [Streptomyces sp. FXJ1.4098]|nr:hypothetical protein [Streptomyces sp. FXJ1.4098]